MLFSKKAPVVQWIEQETPKLWMEVRFLPGAHFSKIHFFKK